MACPNITCTSRIVEASHGDTGEQCSLSLIRGHIVAERVDGVLGQVGPESHHRDGRPRVPSDPTATMDELATPPPAVDLVRVETTLQMRDAVHAAVPGADLLIMNAAVADFRPAEFADRKIKKGDDEQLELLLVRNPDILGGLAERREFLKVGFAAETNDLEAYARSKLDRKGLDLIIANEAVASIGHDDIQVTLLDARGAERLERQPKEQAAARILGAIVARWPERLAPDRPA